MVLFHLLQLDLQLTSAVVNGRLGLDYVDINYVHAPAGEANTNKGLYEMLLSFDFQYL